MAHTSTDTVKTVVGLLLAFCWYIKFIGSRFEHPLFWATVHLASIPIAISILRRSYHGLSQFPGPWLWSVTRLPMFWYLCKGELPQKIAQLHEKYGEVVRIAPTELSFTCEEAWAPIYNKPVNKPQLRKDPTQFLRSTSGVGGLHHEHSDSAHGHVRRNFSHAFAEKTMLEQERIIQSYISHFITRIQHLDGKAADVCNLYNCLTFDIIGDLVFGESFGSLEDSTLHPWIRNIFTHVAAMIVVGMIQKFTFVFSVLSTLMRRKMREAEYKHHAFVLEKLNRRLELETERPDFITHVQKSLNTPSGINLTQLEETVNQLIIGGSETTATVLSCCTHLLLTNPNTITQLKSLIRPSFPTSSSITMKNLNHLSSLNELNYLHAVLSETLRLFPPTPGNLTRLTPSGGCEIAGRTVAGDMLVGVNLYAAGRSEENFKDAGMFKPERWLGGEEYESDKLKSVQSFSIGPRSCIGKNLANMELCLVLTRLIFEFDLELQPESQKWSKGMKIWGFFDKPPLMVKFVPVQREPDSVMEF